VKERSKSDHITPILFELHWLPIEARIRHKIAVLMIKVVSTSKQVSKFTLQIVLRGQSVICRLIEISGFSTLIEIVVP